MKGPVKRPGITLELPRTGDQGVAIVRDALSLAGNQLVDRRWRGDTLTLSVLYARQRGSETATPEVLVLAMIPPSRADGTALLIRLEGWYAPVEERAELGTIHRRVVSSTTPRAYPVRSNDGEWKRLEVVAQALEEAGAKRVP
jgi:hypothetical protein